MNYIIIEDNEKHISDLKEGYGPIINPFNNDKDNPYLQAALKKTAFLPRIFLARNYDEFSKQLSDAIDGVIVDLYFPYFKGGEELPIGLRVAYELHEKGIPFVINTLAHSHDYKVDWMLDAAREKGWPSFRGNEGEGKKQWKEAFHKLEEIVCSKR